MSWLVVLTELGIGVALIFGIATRYASLFTFVYLIIATAIAHRYWEAQPAAVATFVMSALWISAKGAITADTIKLFLIGLPALFAGTWLGLKLFGRLNEATFRKVVLVLLLASGIALIV